MRTITVEELDIIVQASVEQALTEFKKIVPQLKKTTKQIEENLNNVQTKGMVAKVQQAVQQVKQKVNEIKNTGIDKQLQNQFDKAGTSVEKYQGQLEEAKQKLRQVYAEMDNIQANTWKQYTPEGVELGNKAIEPTVNKALGDNKQYQNLSKEATKLEQQIVSLNGKLNTTKQEYNQIAGQIQEANLKQGLWGNAIKRIKSSLNSLKSSTDSIKKSFNQLPSITTKVNTKISQMGKGMKQGIGHVFKYAAALISLESIYGALSGIANAWLGSQNAEAQQLNANIEYMKYALGSALAPVIQFITNLVYKLLKAIQSVVYALTGVNIFANASSKAYAGMANSASKASKASKEQSKSLAGVHNEINNIQDTENAGDTGNGGGSTGSIAPSFDLSQLDNTPSSIIEAIKKGDWYEVGVTLGEKLNQAMNNIPWEKIQNSARKIGAGVANLLNGFIGTTDWTQVGNTFAQGINTIIYYGYSFITTFNWGQFGQAIGNAINGFFNNIDWATAGQTLSEGIKGVLNTITQTLLTIDWSGIGQNIITFMTNIDWQGIVSGLCSALGAALGGASALIASILLEAIIYPLANYFLEKTEEAGGNIVLGILKGIVDGLIGIGEWIYNNMIYPFISAFCEALGINSPSTVFQEFGKNIIQGLFNGIQSLVDTITQIWNNIKQTATEIFTNIKTAIVNKVQEIKEGITQKFKDAYNSIKNIFSNIGNFFSGIWNTVKNTFSNLGTSIGNAISNAVKNGINGVISLIQNTINKAIGLINGAIGLINMIPGVNIGRISTISLPRLATGAVLKVPTVAEMAEYPGASQNPEIVTPQNIMEETFDRVMARYQDNNNGQPIYLTVNVGNKKLGQILLDDLRDRKRRTGSGIEALVGG